MSADPTVIDSSTTSDPIISADPSIALIGGTLSSKKILINRSNRSSIALSAPGSANHSRPGSSSGKDKESNSKPLTPLNQNHLSPPQHTLISSNDSESNILTIRPEDEQINQNHPNKLSLPPSPQSNISVISPTNASTNNSVHGSNGKILTCQVCNNAEAVIHCIDCNKNICNLNGCNRSIHTALRTHQRVPIIDNVPDYQHVARPSTAASQNSVRPGTSGGTTPRSNPLSPMTQQRSGSIFSPSHKKGGSSSAHNETNIEIIEPENENSDVDDEDDDDKIPTLNTVNSVNPENICEQCIEFESVSYCLECEVSLCEICFKKIHKPSRMANHKFVSHSERGQAIETNSKEKEENKEELSTKIDSRTTSPLPPLHNNNNNGSRRNSITSPTNVVPLTANNNSSSTNSSPTPPRTASRENYPTKVENSENSEICQNCDTEPALIYCEDCNLYLCRDDNNSLHAPLKAKSHNRYLLTKPPVQPK